MLILVRHGRTAANAAGLLQGRMDLDLDDEGRRQAVAIGASCTPDVVIASPLRRAVQTAEAFGLPVEIDERFLELDYGEFDGRPLGEIPKETWAAWRSDPDFVPPGGESLRMLQSRVEAGLQDLADRYADRTVAMVSHVSPIKAGVAWALGVGPETSWRTHVAQASISRVRMSPGAGPVLASFNETSHLETQQGGTA